MAKRLFGSGQSKTPQQRYDITPPSSPEQYDSSHTVRYEGCVQWIMEILLDTTIIHRNYCTDK